MKNLFGFLFGLHHVEHYDCYKWNVFKTEVSHFLGGWTIIRIQIGNRIFEFHREAWYG